MSSDQSERINFSSATRDLVADRAGNQCSFPTCNRRTIGPGAGQNEVSGDGIGAHIYSASPRGPRGQGGLSREELEQPENCIWLCSTHAKLVDNNRGVAFPPETLHSYKALQEARVRREVQGLYSPIGWVHELTLLENPTFKPSQKVRLSKLNLIYGANESGKSALAEWIAGIFDLRYLRRWWDRKGIPIHIQLSYLNPQLNLLDLRISSKSRFDLTISGTDVPFNPIPLRIITLRDACLRFEDDLLCISNNLRISPLIVKKLVHEIHSFPHARVRNLCFKKNKDGKRTLYSDVDGTVPGLPLRSLSGRETERVFMEFATAAARVSGRYAPTMLVLDGCPLILFEGFFEFYSHHLLDPDNQFQTLMCIPSRQLNLDKVRWNGWEVLRTSGTVGDIVVNQDLRPGLETAIDDR